MRDTQRQPFKVPVLAEKGGELFFLDKSHDEQNKSVV